MQVVDSEGYLKVKLVGGPVGPFVPYTGATANVDLGEYELKAGQLTLDTSPTGTAVVGTTRWNNTLGSSETTLKGGSVILKNGVDLVARVVNKVTPNATLTKANYTAVRVSGAQGQRLAVAYAQANSDANSADTIGLVIETIATNQEGFIMTVGQIEGVNTTGSLQGETWADGDVLYLSPTTPGALTNIKPTGLTGHIVVMGYVEYAHVNNGKIYVKIMNGWELDELHNVYINPATLANNNILQYDSADQLWKNQVLSTGLTVGTTPISSGTIGRVLFQGTGNVLQQSSSLFWDSTNNRLGIGTSSPFGSFDVRDGDIFATISSNANLRSRLTYQGLYVSRVTDGTYPERIISTASFWEYHSRNAHVFYRDGSPLMQLGSTGLAAFISLNTTGNVLINTTTDAGFRLDVNGTARVQGNATVQSLLVPTTNLYDIGTLGVRFRDGYFKGILLATEMYAEQFRFAATNYKILNVGGTQIAQWFGTGNLLIQNGGTFTDAGFRLDVNGTARVSGNLTFGFNTTYITTSSTGGGINAGINTFFNNGAVWIDDTSVRALDITYNNGIKIANTTRYPLSLGTSSKAVASAQLEMVSTTQGFLPPRMTQTQRNAIASPAIGLEIYQTDATEGKYIYKSSGWTYIG
jgi:nitrogen fixation protein